MIISKRQLNKWLIRLEYGDFTKIGKIGNMKPQAVGRALRTGRMAQKTFFVFQEYFLKKESKIHQSDTKVSKKRC